MTVVKLVLDESDKWARCSFTPKKKKQQQEEGMGKSAFFFVVGKTPPCTFIYV